MALIHDDMPEVLGQFVQAIADGVDDADGQWPDLELSTADPSGIDAEELMGTVAPLIQKFLVVHEHERGLFPRPR